MENAVALVQAYLRINGYFTVAEYPVIEAVDRGGYRTLTDLDVLAFRFPFAGRLVPGANQNRREGLFQPDPDLGVDYHEPDLIIGEIKEGKAELNRGAQDPAVMSVALRRFGCCNSSEYSIVDDLLRDGEAHLSNGYRVRLVAFGTSTPAGPCNYTVIQLQRVRAFLESYIRDHWKILKHGQFKDRAFGFLITLEKIRQAGTSKRQKNPLR